MEIEEADYLIVTTQSSTSTGKKELVTSQLKELGLQEGTDFVEYVLPPEDDDTDICKVLLSISIPEHLMDEFADKMGLEANLAHNLTAITLKGTFKTVFKDAFTAFDSDERLEIIDEFLDDQIDFQELMVSGVIEDHFPLHKRNTIAAIRASMAKYKGRLLRGFLTGHYHKYFQPLNMMKNYYGEKYAFEYAYLLHYQAWLTYPAIIGSILFINCVVRFILYRDMMTALDSEWNALFGLFVALWATAFHESWKRKQRYIQYMWNCKDSSHTQ